MIRERKITIQYCIQYCHLFWLNAWSYNDWFRGSTESGDKPKNFWIISCSSNKESHSDERGLYRIGDLYAPGVTQEGESGKPWRGINPSEVGRHWSAPRREAWPEGVEPPENYESLSVHEKLDALDASGLIFRKAVFPSSSDICLRQRVPEYTMSLRTSIRLRVIPKNALTTRLKNR